MEKDFTKWALFQHAPTPMCLTDTEGNFIYTNTEWQKLTGYNEAELKTMGFRDITPASDLIGDLADIKEVLASGERTSVSFIKKYIRKDGVIVEFVLVANTVMEDGEIVRFVGFALPPTAINNNLFRANLKISIGLAIAMLIDITLHILLLL